jgi:hypothetical protein
MLEGPFTHNSEGQTPFGFDVSRMDVLVVSEAAGAPPEQARFRATKSMTKEVYAQSRKLCRRGDCGLLACGYAQRQVRLRRQHRKQLDQQPRGWAQRRPHAA